MIISSLQCNFKILSKQNVSVYNTWESTIHSSSPSWNCVFWSLKPLFLAKCIGMYSLWNLRQIWLAFCWAALKFSRWLSTLFEYIRNISDHDEIIWSNRFITINVIRNWCERSLVWDVFNCADKCDQNVPRHVLCNGICPKALYIVFCASH